MTDWKRLTEPFPTTDIEWRVGEAGKGQNGIWAKVLAYMTSRAVMDRLDTVVGPENWQDAYHAGPDGGVVCRLSLRVDGEWITKEDGAENTNIEAVKGGISDAFKRAAVKWGIGRYLYDLPEAWANVHDKGKHYSRLPEKQGRDPFRWDPPSLPPWALPAGANTKPRVTASVEPQEAAPAPKETGAAPKSGWDLFDEARHAQGFNPEDVIEFTGCQYDKRDIAPWLRENNMTYAGLLSAMMNARLAAERETANA